MLDLYSTSSPSSVSATTSGMDSPGDGPPRALASDALPAGSTGYAEAGPGPGSQASAAARKASPARVAVAVDESSQAGEESDHPRAKATTMSAQDKAAMLRDKEARLAEVADRHDDLIRELFHMERFVTIVTGFDPAVVKHDKSPVFLDYLAERDLVTRFATSSRGAAPRGRTTRRAFADRKGALALAPAPAVPAQAKINGSAGHVQAATGVTQESVLAPLVNGATPATPAPPSKRKHTAKAAIAKAEAAPPLDTTGDTPESVARALAKRSHRRQIAKESGVPSRRSDRTRPEPAQETLANIAQHEPPSPGGASGKKRAQRDRDRRSHHKRRKTSPSPDLGPAPPPRYTHPEQLPPAITPFGHSITGLVSSYRQLDDKEVDEATLRKEAQAAAGVLLRVRHYQRLGRMLEVDSPDYDVAAAAIASLRPPAEHKRAPDHQAHLLAHVAQVRNAMLNEYKGHLALARKLSRAVQAHFEHRQGAAQREAKEEERRKRTTMRELTRAVKAQWKLAVNVVRARKFAEAKAEQDRMGKAHLQSILDRSTGLIEAHRDHISGRRRTSASASVDSSGEGDEGKTADGEERDSYGEDEDMQEAINVLEDDNDGHTDEESAAEDSEDDQSDVEGEAEDIEDLRQLFSDAEDATSEIQTPAAEQSDSDRDPLIQVVTAELEEEGGDIAMEEAKQTSPLDDVDERAANPLPQEGATPAELTEEAQVKEEAIDEAGSVCEQVDDNALMDHGMDIAMEAAEGSVREDSEDEGLKADVDLGELLSRYGYEADQVASLKATTTAAENSEDEGESQSGANDAAEGSGALDDGIRRSNRKRKPRTIRDSYSPLARPETPEGLEQDEEEDDGVDDFEPTPDDSPVRPPFLLRGTLRPYQQAGLEWLAGLYHNRVNGILADEMGLGKTIQTIALLGHLACDKGQWGPHLIVVPTSVILNWEMEFKKFLPGMRVLTYYGNQKERKERRIGWATEGFFQVCITSYQLVLADQHIFRRKNWQYLILDEAHNIKNFRSQRWQTLLGFKSERRLLLTGTPLQNNLMELWSLMYFLMPNGASAEMSEASGFANHREFSEWFSNPMEKAVEHGTTMTDETRATIERLHTILRPYMLRRLKSEVETQLPGKHEHVTYCKLSKRQRFLYDEFMSRASTRESLVSGGYLGVANCLMQLRKVCNHPDLFEVRPVRTSLAMGKSVASSCRDTLSPFDNMTIPPADKLNLDLLNLRLVAQESEAGISARATRRLDATTSLPCAPLDNVGEDAACDTRSIAEWQKFRQRQAETSRAQRWTQNRYLNRLRCQRGPMYGVDLRRAVACPAGPSWQLPGLADDRGSRQVYTLTAGSGMTVSWKDRLDALAPLIDRFAVITPAVTTSDLANFAVPGVCPEAHPELLNPDFDLLHKPAVKLQIAFPDASLLQYDCGKLQVLHNMLKDLKAGGHRVIIFTQMTKMLDVLELFLSHNGHRYFRLDGGTKIEERQRITERFNTDTRIFAFIASTRAGGVGINLTGADTVIFYDADYNVAMDRQAMDRAHRIGQTREVNIYRLVTSHTVEENILRKSNQKRLLDNLVIQEGNFTTDFFGKLNLRDMLGEDILKGLETSDSPLGRAGSEADERRQMETALAQAEDEEDAEAARIAEGEVEIDDAEFAAADQDRTRAASGSATPAPSNEASTPAQAESTGDVAMEDEDGMLDGEPGSIDEYMLRWVESDWAYFS